MDNYKKILELMEEYKETKFWEKLDGDDIFELVLSDRKVYVSILGRLGSDYGIVVYPDKNSLFNTMEMTFGEYGAFPDRYLRMDCIKIQLFDCGHLVSKENKTILRKNGIRSNDAVIALSPGKNPRLCTEEECALFLEVLEKLFVIIKHFDRLNLVYDGPFFLNKLHSVSIVDGKPVLKKKKFPESPEKEIIAQTLDEEKLAKVHFYGKKGTFAIGLFYFPFFMTDHGEEYYPNVVMIMDLDSQLIIDCLVVKDEDKSNIGNLILESFVKKHYRPKNITFTSSEILYLCGFLLSELEIKYLVDNELDDLFEAWEAMRHYK